ncbi:hypothetical protein L218DRAFT_5762 [Marasmius fiardii PR-910]|nr:hypothetical protein L218DRAFT_5762 [Marasmius fiardii PR-910]
MISFLGFLWKNCKSPPNTGIMSIVTLIAQLYLGRTWAELTVVLVNLSYLSTKLYALRSMEPPMVLINPLCSTLAQHLGGRVPKSFSCILPGLTKTLLMEKRIQCRTGRQLRLPATCCKLRQVLAIVDSSSMMITMIRI